MRPPPYTEELRQLTVENERLEAEIRRLLDRLEALETNEYDHEPSDVPPQYLPGGDAVSDYTGLIELVERLANDLRDMPNEIDRALRAFPPSVVPALEARMDELKAENARLRWALETVAFVRHKAVKAGRCPGCRRIAERILEGATIEAALDGAHVPEEER